jgi:hypothetical protein
MKDRFMGENTRLLYDLMHYLEENDMYGLLLLVDFEKAFDSIEWKFLQKALNSDSVSFTNAPFILGFDLICRESNSTPIINK